MATTAPPRVRMAHLPTPVEPLPRLSAALGGVRLWIKRDDQTGLALGGNKTRKLEYLVAQAQADDARTLITRGAAQSNHCRQTAAAAARFGFDCMLVLRGAPPPQPNGNLLLDRLLGAELVWSGSRDPEMVQMMGIDLSNIFTLVFGLGTFMAAAAGVLAAPMWGVQPAMGTSALMPSFAVVVIGGLGSFWGAVIAGLLVGEIVGITVMIWPIASDLMMYVLMALVLLVRPRGLMGEVWERFD